MSDQHETSGRASSAEAGKPRPEMNWPSVGARDVATFVDAVSQMHARAIAEGQASLLQPPQSDYPRGPCGLDAPRTGTESQILLVASAADPLPGVVPVSLDLVVRPTADNGWRSEIIAEGAGGRPVSAELVAAPVGAGPARHPRPVSAAAPFRLPGGGARRALALRDLGEADRQYCAGIRPEPHRVLTVEGGRHCDEDGRLRLAALVEVFRSTERLVPVGGRNGPKPQLRRLHVFERLAPGGVLSISTLLSRGAPPAPSSVSLRSCARRLSDGAVVAFSETVLR